MDSFPEQNSNSSTSDLQPDQTSLIVQVLKEVCPVEADIVGHNGVENIVTGGTFKEVSGGSHINLMDSIAILSCVAGIAQVILTIWNPWKESESNDVKLAASEDIKNKARTAVNESASQNPRFLVILSNQPELFDQVFLVLEEMPRNQPHSKK
jgi:hypothetical protein